MGKQHRATCIVGLLMHVVSYNVGPRCGHLYSHGPMYVQPRALGAGEANLSSVGLHLQSWLPRHTPR